MEALLDTAGLSKSFPKRAHVLREVSLSITPGESVGLIGPNGAGKTTLLRILVGLIRPTNGRVSWGLLPREVGYFAGGATIAPQVRAGEWGELASQGRFRTDERRYIRKLSRGTRQMLGLQAVLAIPNTKLVLLDEPWEGLDPDGARWLSEAIRFRQKEGSAFLLSSHRLYDLAGACDRYSFLIDGKIRTVTASELRGDGPVTGNDLMAAFDRLRASG
jgi:ABC-type multidrug transport system ATPase subunit